VSTASASRALAGGAGVSPELHGRIIAAAARLGYHANLSARALASRRSGLVGVIVETLADPAVAGLAEALERALVAEGYGVVFATSGGSPEQSLAAMRTLLGRGVEAFAFAAVAPVRAEVDLMSAHGVGWACLSDEPGGGPLAIDTGRRRGGALACRYLLDLGHLRFAVVATAGAGTRDGAAAALAESASATLVGDTAAGGGRADAARLSMRALLERDAPPTAVVCSSDAEALAAVRECVSHGVGVPGEVSIVGFGDAEFARHSMPGLTTLRISTAAIGARAAEALLANLRGQAPLPPYEAPIKLVVRETTGPPP
jgi:LacI family transcriptional regulator